ncbi:hypothetical protein Syun_018412 [Stephania yunnanensis]|uniref:GAG-pre-integrase domain-containing protein n=1 Tax=Stephania yunnanensis TaxID=152371 RepID=A0AAP0ITA6_9MAGN
MNKTNSSVYIEDSYDIWHAILGHVNNISIHKMVNLNLLPKLNIDFKQNVKYAQNGNLLKKPFMPIQGRSNELLKLIYSDLCDYKSTSTRGGKNYYITFIDDCSKYSYVYLIKTKNEAFDMFKHVKQKCKIN